MIKDIFDEEIKGSNSSGEIDVVRNWIGEANKLKQRGFYVDHGDNRYLSPKEFTEEDFLRTYNMASKFVSSVEEVMIDGDWWENKIGETEKKLS